MTHAACELREQSWRESCARVEDKLRHAEAEIERLKSLGGVLDRMTAEAEAYRIAYAAGEAWGRKQSEGRIAELEADVVFLAINEANFFDPGKLAVGTAFPRKYIKHDGTPADILRAVREARNGHPS